jgi:putative flippase GtrA
MRFCAAGTLGFVIDAGILQLLVVGAHINPYAARVVSFLSAASATWLINRRYTFAVNHKPTQAEWRRYVSLMLLGALVNFGVFSLCIAFWDLARTQPWLGVALGSIAGMGLNFSTSRLMYQTAATRVVNGMSR